MDLRKAVGAQVLRKGAMEVHVGLERGDAPLGADGPAEDVGVEPRLAPASTTCIPGRIRSRKNEVSASFLKRYFLTPR